MMLPYLVMGNGRYLDVWGKVHPPRRTFTDAEIASNLRIDPNFDVEMSAAPASPTRLTNQNRAYWEENAARGGHTLDELLEP
ncbi:MAG: hypothetical protein U5O16_00985 [Rhodococcus sp. (in: high G+C Gram-positive bacteria)]|uniref:hypothetical protein n=1 Tax=Rhodococcus sp. TaxID=1831 RepID=UPI002AD96B95|nr:hypothetical protein [Rhodococcus sp. (in: high G+C Gram-positive bacteria)]